MGENYLGEFEQIVLLAVARLGDKAYGVPIRREITERAGRGTSVGALYSTLDRLETKGFVHSWFIRNGNALEPAPEGEHPFGKPEAFTPQRVLAESRLKRIVAVGAVIASAMLWWVLLRLC